LKVAQSQTAKLARKQNLTFEHNVHSLELQRNTILAPGVPQQPLLSNNPIGFPSSHTHKALLTGRPPYMIGFPQRHKPAKSTRSSATQLLTAQFIIWFTSFPRLCSKNLEFRTSSHKTTKTCIGSQDALQLSERSGDASTSAQS